MELRILILLLCVFLAGCAGRSLKGIESVTHAGVSTLEYEPVFAQPGEIRVGTKMKVLLGRDVGGYTVTVSYNSDNKPIITITATGVMGTEGQKAAALATVAVNDKLTELGMSLGDKLPLIAEVITKALNPIPSVNWEVKE